MTQSAVAVVDGGCFLVLQVMDLVINGVFALPLVVLEGAARWLKRFRYILFRSPAPLSEFNLAIATISIGIILSQPNWNPVGGRDCFVAVSQFVEGLPRVTDGAVLWWYSRILIALGFVLLAGLGLADTSPGVRREALWIAKLIWLFSFLLIFSFYPVAITTVFVGILAKTSYRLHRLISSEVQPGDERQESL